MEYKVTRDPAYQGSDKPTNNDVTHHKYIKREKGKDGKWRYWYKDPKEDSDKSNSWLHDKPVVKSETGFDLYTANEATKKAITDSYNKYIDEAMNDPIMMELYPDENNRGYHANTYAVNKTRKEYEGKNKNIQSAINLLSRAYLKDYDGNQAFINYEKYNGPIAFSNKTMKAFKKRYAKK